MTRPTQHPASNSTARKRHDAPTCLVCGNSVPVDVSALAAAKAEGRAEVEAEDARRSTGGNRFIPGDSDRTALVSAVSRGLHDLHAWAETTDRAVDVGAITITTKRIPSGAISVSVTGDLTALGGAL